jgi:ubiquinone/menaquinone biosynthesis C-methylase UbiE
MSGVSRTERDNEENLPPPPLVSPELYDDDYYLTTCAGSDEWRGSGGAAVAGVYVGSLQRAHLQPGEVLVDIGTGRGELLAVAVESGAGRAVGVEYSPAAVRLTSETIRVHGVGDRAEVLLADARRIPLDDGTADLVTMLDVVEHLAPRELDQTLSEAFRLLRPGGRILAHTFPSRTIYDVTYRLQRGLHPRRRRTWPVQPRVEYELLMHVNEQTVATMRRSLRRAGFSQCRGRLGEWVYTDFVPEERAKQLYRRLAHIPLVNRLGVANIWGEGVKP